MKVKRVRGGAWNFSARDAKSFGHRFSDRFSPRPDHVHISFRITEITKETGIPKLKKGQPWT